MEIHTSKNVHMAWHRIDSIINAVILIYVKGSMLFTDEAKCENEAQTFLPKQRNGYVYIRFGKENDVGKVFMLTIFE